MLNVLIGCFKKLDFYKDVQSQFTTLEQTNESQSESESGDTDESSDDEPLLNTFPMDNDFDENDSNNNCMVCNSIEPPPNPTNNNETIAWAECHKCKKCESKL